MDDQVIQQILRARHNSELLRIAKLKDESECAIMKIPLANDAFTILACRTRKFFIPRLAVNNLADYAAEPSGDFYDIYFSHFLDFSGTAVEERKEFIYKSYLTVNSDVRRQGLSKIMLEELVSELAARKAFHIVFFTEAGRNYLKKNYDELGYIPLNIIAEPPKPYEGFPDWMYKDYANGK